MIRLGCTQMFIVERKCDGANSLFTFQLCDFRNLLLLQTPELYSLISTSCGQNISKRVECHRCTRHCMRNHFGLYFSGQSIDNLVLIDVVKVLRFDDRSKVLVAAGSMVLNSHRSISTSTHGLKASTTSSSARILLIFIHIICLVHDLNHLVFFFEDSYCENLAFLGYFFVFVFHDLELLVSDGKLVLIALNLVVQVCFFDQKI